MTTSIDVLTTNLTTDLTTDLATDFATHFDADLTDDVADNLAEAAVPALDRSASSTLGNAEANRVRDQFVDLINKMVPSIVFDPIVHIQSGAHVGDEALARFPGSATPAEWFRSAHALGVGDDLELRVLGEVIGRLDQRSGFVGVNVSPQVLVDPRCVDLLRASQGAELVVELTDQTAAPRLPVLRARFDEIRDLGIRVAVHVSEFGLATTQTVMLAQPDVVKLDPDLTAAVATGRAMSTVADNFFTYCRHEGVFVVAVGVERREQLAVLRDRGVDATQGRIYSTADSSDHPALVESQRIGKLR